MQGRASVPVEPRVRVGPPREEDLDEVDEDIDDFEADEFEDSTERAAATKRLAKEFALLRRKDKAAADALAARAKALNEALVLLSSQKAAAACSRAYIL